MNREADAVINLSCGKVRAQDERAWALPVRKSLRFSTMPPFEGHSFRARAPKSELWWARVPGSVPAFPAPGSELISLSGVSPVASSRVQVLRRLLIPRNPAVLRPDLRTSESSLRGRAPGRKTLRPRPVTLVVGGAGRTLARAPPGLP